LATAIDTSVAIDLAPVARDFKLSLDQIVRTVELLDSGNTVPFITRYRKDRTGGLDEEQIRRVNEQVKKLRMLAERKTTILKSIESQGKLTAELASQIQAAPTAKRLEDLYLPYKPKKQTLATLARQRGLEPLADEIYEGRVATDELAERATHFVRVDKQLHNIDEVIQGVGHVLAERFSERPDLRGKLRKLLWRKGKIVSSRIGGDAKESVANTESDQKTQASPKPQEVAAVPDEIPADATVAVANTCASGDTDSAQPPDNRPTGHSADSQAPTSSAAEVTAEPSKNAAAVEETAVAEPETAASRQAAEPASGEVEQTADEQAQPDVPETPPAATSDPTASEPEQSNSASSPSATVAEAKSSPAPATKPSVQKRSKKKDKKKDKKRDKQEKAFKDYFDFSEAVSRIPPHRVLAINRGERARVLRVKLELDSELVEREAAELVLPAEHPHAEFLKQCLMDALSRLVLPSLEREIRRELTEKAESHAVDVFAKNLRSLLLQPPIRDCRPLALDPGFRNGCKFSALDGFGNVLAQGVAYIVGKPERIQEGRKKIAETIKEHKLNVIAIGNGTACRETEQLVAEMLADELKDQDVSYVVVNEAGASVYSTSPLGREELPEYDAVLRGAISIGRRLLDPLSELVKINPANIGVGMYQHDVKAKHLQDSLDAVVESCVNFVGVDVNTASPALLRYVSGLNQLTARRLFEHRQQHGPFKSREQLKEVAGFGEATFVQSAGFLKINGGDNPLDATWIHPESYEVTRKLLDKLGSNVDDLATRPTQTPAGMAENEPTALAAGAETNENGPSGSEASACGTLNRVVSPGQAQAAPADGPTEPKASQTPELTDKPAEAQNGSPRAEARPVLAERAKQLDMAATAADLGIGGMLLSDILSDLQRPGRDPREDLPKPIFRRGILKLEDLTQGMELTGTVLNVVDFGAFVDIGLHDTGLVHISRLANRYVKDPHEVISVGDVLTVWVHEIDKERRRVSLTAIKPGTEKARGERDGRPDRPQKESRPPRRRDRAAVKKKHATGGRRDSKRAKSGKHSRSFEKKRKPKPVKPITDAMAEGREPMRTFSDLAQFFEKKATPEDQDQNETSEG